MSLDLDLVYRTAVFNAPTMHLSQAVGAPYQINNVTLTVKEGQRKTSYIIEYDKPSTSGGAPLRNTVRSRSIHDLESTNNGLIEYLQAALPGWDL